MQIVASATIVQVLHVAVYFSELPGVGVQDLVSSVDRCGVLCCHFFHCLNSPCFCLDVDPEVRDRCHQGILYVHCHGAEIIQAGVLVRTISPLVDSVCEEGAVPLDRLAGR